MAGSKRHPHGDSPEAVLRDALDGMPEALRVAHANSRHLAETKFRAVADHAAEPIIASGTDSTVTYANPAAARLFGYDDAPSMVGLPAVSLYRDPEARDQVMRAMERTDHLEAIDLVIALADGSAAKVRASLTRVKDLEGGTVELLGIINSTSELLRTREQLSDALILLEQANDDLVQSNAELERFAYAVSHDLQEPLRMVTSFLQMLEQHLGDGLDERGSTYLDFVVDGATRMDQQIRDLLDYSRIKTRGRALEPFDGEWAAERAIERQGAAIEAAGAVVTRDPMPRLVGDQLQLMAVWDHLLRNALTYNTADVPRLHLGAEAAGDRWLLSLSDNGIGIDPQFDQRIFGIFKRLHTREEYPGNGIGLALCQRIVDRHGGRIWVRPNDWGGSVFYFTIPAEDTADGDAIGGEVDHG